MDYQKELDFLLITLNKIRIKFKISSINDPTSKIIDKNLEPIIDYIPFKDEPITKYFHPLRENTIYKLNDIFNLNYIFFVLPATTPKQLLMIGPFTNSIIDSKKILETEEAQNIPLKLHKFCIEYFATVPICNENSHIFSMIEAFAEKIWNNYVFEDVNKKWSDSTFILNRGKNDNLDTTILDMTIMEKRYELENQLMNAISLGQINKSNQLLKLFGSLSFEKRVPDAIRDFKNYLIVMNTILRKSAEKGGVHPLHIDTISSTFAKKIEQLSTISSGSILLNEMFKDYCELVRNHSMKGYSRLIKNTIIIIESDLSSNLSLSTLATSQNVSLGYLSSLFKKETGTTLSEFVREKRMNHAMNLLSNTKLQIQTIAHHCGIIDLQYFSKQFKKYSGKSPKEYRESVQG